MAFITYNWRLFLIALQFLTCIPVRLPDMPEAPEIGRSVLFYALVGLLFGSMLIALNLLLQNSSDNLRAALLLCTWILLSGALHLDGLADSADAALGGLGDRRKTLAIMKDPHCGSLAVIALVMVLLLKFTALSDKSWLSSSWGLLWIPLCGRQSAALLFATTPYVSPVGLGTALAAHLPHKALLQQTAILSVLCIVFLGMQGIILLFSSAFLFVIWRGFWLRRIGGITGDIAGAMVELTEAAGLVALAIF